ncbi:MAG: type III-B CRISPR module RAMP protein Cmr4 [Gemmataceae bacterium]
MPNNHAIRRIYWLHALTPTHAGVGRGLGYIDLPIDREKVTNWPIIRGSAFKGVLADYFGATDERRKKDELLRAAFGVTGAEEESNSGSLVPTDARLVCLPIRSFRGTFAWCTSPLALTVLRRMLQLAGVAHLPDAPTPLEETKAHHPKSSALVESKKVYLEELDFDGVECPVAQSWAEKIAAWVFGSSQEWQQHFQKRFAIVPDVAFDYFCQTGTEVHTRVRINDETKTVVEGALWTEESLPAETLLAGVIQCERVFQQNGKSQNSIEPARLMDHFAKEELVLQIGGKATVGRGQMRCVFVSV